MSRFILVKENRYNDRLLINVDNISVIVLETNTVLVNGGETGWYHFDNKEISKIIEATGIETLTNYYLGLLPEKKKASRTSPDNGDSNHSHRLGFNIALKEMEASIRGGGR